jgi:hypothetical protein
MNAKAIRPWSAAGLGPLSMIGWRFPGTHRGLQLFEPRTAVTAAAGACISSSAKISPFHFFLT